MTLINMVPKKPWRDMSADEKLEYLLTVFDDFIAFQNGANARMSARIQALEDMMEQIRIFQPSEPPGT